MTTKTDFSAAEWETLRETPHLVIFAVTVAGASGFFGTIAEALAPSPIISLAQEGSNRLLREISAKDEVKAAIESIKNRVRDYGDAEVIRTSLRREAVGKARAAIELLKQKGTQDDVIAYREFLITLGDNVALAAKEGDFLGFGGERVSEHERTLLADLAEAVGALEA